LKESLVSFDNLFGNKKMGLLSFFLTGQWEQRQEFLDVRLILSMLKSDVSKRNVGIFRNDQVSFFFIGSLIVGDDMVKSFHCSWDQRLESSLGHTVGKTSDTIGTVLSNIKVFFIIGTGPFANLDKLTANLINHHFILNFTFFDEIDEEEGGVLDLLWRDNLVLGHNRSKVWLNASIHDTSRILLINRHYNVATFSNIGSST